MLVLAGKAVLMAQAMGNDGEIVASDIDRERLQVRESGSVCVRERVGA